MVKYKNPQNVLLKSVIVGLVLLILDFLGHLFLTETMETFYYFLAKPIIAGYVAFLMFAGIFNIFSLKKRKFPFYLYYATLFGLIHGIYYRVLDFIQGNPFFFRVRDIIINDFVIFPSNIIMGTIGWWIIHSLIGFLGGVLIVKLFFKK